MFEVILDTWSRGGIVLVPIFFAGFWGFFLVFRTYVRLGRNVSRTDLIPAFEDLGRKLEARDEAGARKIAGTFPGVVGEGVQLFLAHRTMPEKSLRRMLEECYKRFGSIVGRRVTIHTSDRRFTSYNGQVLVVASLVVGNATIRVTFEPVAVPGRQNVLAAYIGTRGGFSLSEQLKVVGVANGVTTEFEAEFTEEV